MKLLLKCLEDLKLNFRECEVEIIDKPPINLDAGFDSLANRKSIYKAGFRPNIKENKRNRKTIKKGRRRYFDNEIYKTRKVVERSFSWVDKFRRVIVQYEWYQEIFLAFNLLAFTLVNLKDIC